jgi:hypothetical protein
MKRRLSSHRFRRRAVWTVAVVASLGGVAAAAVLIGNTGTSQQTAVRNAPAWVYHEPKLHRLSERERLELLATSTKFVQTAVARRDLDRAWAMLGPDLRAGMTRKEWDTGNNTVVPFPAVGIATWDVLYSYEDDVAFDLSLVSEPGHDLVGKTFTIELRRDARRNRWLVASWVPKGLAGAGQSIAAASAPPPSSPRAHLSTKWLLLPLAILALIVVTPIVVVARSLLVGRRAARRYAQELASYRSTSSPS